MIYKFKLSYVPYLENNNWDFCWTDNAVLPETLSKMQRIYIYIIFSTLKNKSFSRNVFPCKKKSFGKKSK